MRSEFHITGCSSMADIVVPFNQGLWQFLSLQMSLRLLNDTLLSTLHIQSQMEGGQKINF